jgi:protein TonB
MSTDSGISWHRTVSLSATLAVHLALLALLLGTYPAPVPRPEESAAAMVVRLIAEPRKLAGEASPRPREAAPPPGRTAKETPRAARVRNAAAPRPITEPQSVPVAQAPAPPPRAPATPNDLPAPAAPVSGPVIAAAGTAGGAGLENGGSGDSGASAGIRFATRAQPLMPRSMRGSKWSGYALIGLRIGADGRPKEVVVLRSSGVRDIDRTARLAAQRSTYVPHTTDGRPVEFWGVVPVVFGEATPDVERDLADLAERWRSYHRGMDAYGTTRPAV